ncbi:ABC transporter permease [Cellulomonas sp. URHD0024]|uniref:ABC transporter permease n=1 Tax=Cellulomonas sp. URHD0024 TaxID=1302620 RepID=UPI00042489E0|nr:ABC transporter permease [Cellulomonas sp. URHD0024]
MSTVEQVPPQGSADESTENAIELREVAGLSQGQIVRRRFLRHRGAMVAIVVLTLVVILAFSSVGIGGWTGWWLFTPNEINVVINGGKPTLLLPSWLGGDAGLWFHWGLHPFGQDEIGRDVFARVMRGTQTSLIITATVGIVATGVGIFVGALAGFNRGRTDDILMRVTDLVITMPVIVIGAVLGQLAGGNNPLIFGAFLGLITWTTLARLVRGDFLTLREREFVDAARVAGASNSRIMFKHMLPNAIGVIIVNTTLLMSSAILLETALSYLGVGIKAPATSLGLLISQYQEAFSTRPWLFWWPGLMIVIIALSINFIGDGLRDAFDPRQKRIPSERKMAKAMSVDGSVARSMSSTVAPSNQIGNAGMGPS